MTTYTHILDMAKEADPPADGILSRTIYQKDQIKAVVFGFRQRQELSKHTAAKTERIEDYDVTRGGFMGVGLLFMAATPRLAAWLRGRKQD